MRVSVICKGSVKGLNRSKEPGSAGQRVPARCDQPHSRFMFVTGKRQRERKSYPSSRARPHAPSDSLRHEDFRRSPSACAWIARGSFCGNELDDRTRLSTSFQKTLIISSRQMIELQRQKSRIDASRKQLFLGNRLDEIKSGQTTAQLAQHCKAPEAHVLTVLFKLREFVEGTPSGVWKIRARK